MSTRYVIEGALAEAIAQYLADRPWREVHHLIDGLKKLPVAESPEPAKAGPQAETDE